MFVYSVSAKIEQKETDANGLFVMGGQCRDSSRFEIDGKNSAI